MHALFLTMLLCYDFRAVVVSVSFRPITMACGQKYNFLTYFFPFGFFSSSFTLSHSGHICNMQHKMILKSIYYLRLQIHLYDFFFTKREREMKMGFVRLSLLNGFFLWLLFDLSILISLSLTHYNKF